MSNFHDTLMLIPILAVSLLTQGCIGVGLFGRKTETLDSPRIAGTGIENVFDYHGFEHGSRIITVDQLRTDWGDPLSITPASTGCQEELWTYEFGRIWCGIAPLLVVPVPLVVPVGRQKVVFFLKDGQAIKAEVTNSGSSGFAFFLLTAEGPCKGLLWNDYSNERSAIMRGVQPPATNTPAMRTK